MDITLTDNLKAFRKDKGNTQEELATFLGISVQAVSKWERGEGYPDITLLHRIAAFYNKSVDDLLGVGEIAKQERLKEIEKERLHLTNNGDVKTNVEHMRQALNEFPNEHIIILNLMDALFTARTANLNIDYRNEIIDLGEQLYRDSTDDDIRYSTIQLLCYTYESMGNIEKATNYANKLPSYVLTRNQILCSILKGDELLHLTQNNILQLIDDIYLNICWMISSKPYTESKKIIAYKKALDFYSLLYDDGDYGFFHCRLAEIYSGMAIWYSILGDKENALDSLAQQIKNAVLFDNMKDHKYTAFLVDSIEFEKKHTSKNFMDTYSQLAYKHLSDPRFDFIRDDERFIKLKTQLEPHLT